MSHQGNDSIMDSLIDELTEEERNLPPHYDSTNASSK